MARRTSRGWTCHRQSQGAKCGHVNPSRKRLCESCGKTRPPRKRPAHMAALDLTYEQYIEINGGEFCGICLKVPVGRRLDRDHEHKGDGKARGLLCFACNRQLRTWATVEWLTAAIAYLKRAEARD